MSKEICFIAIVPDSSIRAEVKEFQLYVSKNFQSKHALRAPPHITLIPPFKWNSDEFPALEKELTEFAKKQRPINIRLNNFSTFPPRVVFVDVTENDALGNLQTELKNHMHATLGVTSDRPDLPFHPHVTIAFRDLRKQMFRQAWAHFSQLQYQREFVAEDVYLLQHNGKHWDERRRFSLE
jgi:2'-5' RNA ligase